MRTRHGAVPRSIHNRNNAVVDYFVRVGNIIGAGVDADPHGGAMR